MLWRLILSWWFSWYVTSHTNLWITITRYSPSSKLYVMAIQLPSLFLTISWLPLMYSWRSGLKQLLVLYLHLHHHIQLWPNCAWEGFGMEAHQDHHSSTGLAMAKAGLNARYSCYDVSTNPLRREVKNPVSWWCLWKWKYFVTTQKWKGSFSCH